MPVLTSTDSAETIQAALGPKNLSIQVQDEVGELTDVKSGVVESTDNAGATDTKESAATSTEVENTSDSATGGKDKGGSADVGKEAQKRIEQLLRENGELKGRLEAKEPPAKPKEEKAAKPDEAEAEPKPEDFNTQAEFMKALSKWAAKEARREDKIEAAKNAEKQKSDEVVSNWKKQVDTAKAKYNDWDKAMGEVVIGKIAANMLIHSPDGAELAYYIGKNPAEAEAFNKLTNERDVAMALGEVRAKMKATTTTTSKDKTEVTAKEKPKPITPVGGTSTGASTKAPKDMTYKEYKAKRNQDAAAKRRA